jgi:hypothetical protein
LTHILGQPCEFQAAGPGAAAPPAAGGPVALEPCQPPPGRVYFSAVSTLADGAGPDDIIIFGGERRARSHCRFAPPRIHFIPHSRTYSVPLLLKRQCDRTLGERTEGRGRKAQTTFFKDTFRIAAKEEGGKSEKDAKLAQKLGQL